jgi:hypothetical protein
VSQWQDLPEGIYAQGYLKSLKEVVHFYNTRDVYPFDVESGHCPAGTKEKVNCWPAPEVPQTKDMTVGKLGLTPTKEDQIVRLPEDTDRRLYNTLPRLQHVYGKLPLSVGSFLLRLVHFASKWKEPEERWHLGSRPGGGALFASVKHPRGST